MTAQVVRLNEGNEQTARRAVFRFYETDCWDGVNEMICLENANPEPYDSFCKIYHPETAANLKHLYNFNARVNLPDFRPC